MRKSTSPIWFANAREALFLVNFLIGRQGGVIHQAPVWAAPMRQNHEKVTALQRRRRSTMPKQAVAMTPFGRVRE